MGVCERVHAKQVVDIALCKTANQITIEMGWRIFTPYRALVLVSCPFIWSQLPNQDRMRFSAWFGISEGVC